jgi:hypothetical protein
MVEHARTGVLQLRVRREHRQLDADPANAVASLPIGNPGYPAAQAICDGAENGVGGLQPDATDQVRA